MGYPASILVPSQPTYSGERQEELYFSQSLRARLVIPLGLLGLLSLVGCPTREEYHPPDLIYHYLDIPVGKNPTSIRASDFNGDGFTDLITSNIQGNSLSLLLGKGDGSFQDQKTISACQEPRNVAVDDFNLDHVPDFVVACSGDNHALVFLGQGDGTFLRGAQYLVHRTPVSIATGDFNEDFLPDLAVALRNDKIQILLGMGNGKFRLGSLYEYGDTPTSVATEDLNGDKHLDLAVTNGGPMSHAVSIWLGLGDGTFQAPTDYRTGKRPLGVSFADFNTDRALDLLVINGEMNTITVFLGNGDGTFQEGRESGGDAGPNFGVAQDFDGDKLPDVAVANIQSGSISLLFGNGDGTFHYPPRDYPTPHAPFALTTLLIATDRGEEPGLAVVNNASSNVSIFLHHGLNLRKSQLSGTPAS
ncbi:FG-GAP repeat domain-containing protein [Nitrospira sp. Ecomares 2.1]